GLRRPCLVDRDVDAADPGAVLPHMRDEIAAGIDDRDVHGLSDLGGLLLCGGDDAARILEVHGGHDLLLLFLPGPCRDLVRSQEAMYPFGFRTYCVAAPASSSA